MQMCGALRFRGLLPAFQSKKWVCTKMEPKQRVHILENNRKLFAECQLTRNLSCLRHPLQLPPVGPEGNGAFCTAQASYARIMDLESYFTFDINPDGTELVFAWFPTTESSESGVCQWNSTSTVPTFFRLADPSHHAAQVRPNGNILEPRSISRDTMLGIISASLLTFQTLILPNSTSILSNSSGSIEACHSHDYYEKYCSQHEARNVGQCTLSHDGGRGPLMHRINSGPPCASTDGASANV